MGRHTAFTPLEGSGTLKNLALKRVPLPNYIVLILPVNNDDRHIDDMILAAAIGVRAG